MQSVLRRILGLPDKNTQPARSAFTYATNKEGTQRVQMYEDTSMNAIAARHNANAIYGETGPMFGMKSVIEVKQADGSWVPVSGSTKGVPGMETQIAMLQNYNETGKLGWQPLELGTDAAGTAIADAGTGAAAGAKKPGDQHPPVLGSKRAEVGGATKPATTAAPAQTTPLIATQLKLPWNSPNTSGQMLAAGFDKMLGNKQLGPRISNGQTPRAEQQSTTSPVDPRKPAMIETVTSHAASAEAKNAPQAAGRPGMRNSGLGLF